MDFTDTFFNVAAKVSSGEIIKSPDFPLLHGTHALELLNPKLDTYLLPEVIYSPSKYTEEETYAIALELLASIGSWVNENTPLSSSVLAWEPLCHLLLNGFPTNFDCTSNEDVVNALCVAVIGVVKFILKIGFQGIVYENEDITTLTMDLDFFTAVPAADFINVIDNAMKWCGDNDTTKVFIIFKEWIQVESVLDWKLTPFEKATCITEKSLKWSSIASLINSISTKDVSHLPVGIFNTNAQRKFNNPTPPKPVTRQELSSCLKDLADMFEDLILVIKSAEQPSSLDLTIWLENIANVRHEVSEFECIGMHVVPRMLLQLYLVRDDGSLFGCSTANTFTYLKDFLCLTIKNSSLETHNPPQINEILQALLTPFNQFLTAISQNPARQRQLLSKELLFWDKLHVELEPVELAINKSYSDVYKHNQMPILPVLCFVYYQKLRSMVILSFKSIELALYKDQFELKNAYFVLSYQLDYLLEHMDRLQEMYAYRLKQLEPGNSYEKKLKKLSGVKKQALRQEYDHLKSGLADLNKYQSFIQGQSKYYQAIKKVVEIKLTSLQVLCTSSFTNGKVARENSNENSFNLQMKPLSSIGAPALPTWKEVEKSQTSFNETFELVQSQGKASRVSMLVQGHTAEVSQLANGKKDYQWDRVKRECILAQLELSTILKKEKGNVSIIRDGKWCWFPALSLD